MLTCQSVNNGVLRMTLMVRFQFWKSEVFGVPLLDSISPHLA